MDRRHEDGHNQGQSEKSFLQQFPRKSQRFLKDHKTQQTIPVPIFAFLRNMQGRPISQKTAINSNVDEQISASMLMALHSLYSIPIY